MFHLTKNTYVDYVDFFDYKTDSIVIQDGDYDAAMFDERYGEIVTGTKSKVWGVYKNITAMEKGIGDFESFAFNFKGSHKDSKLAVYCDVDSYQLMIIKWWKGIFPNMTPEEAFELFEDYRDNRLMSTIVVKENLTRSDGSVPKRYYDLSRDNFIAKWRQSEGFRIQHKENTSIEFQLASYFYNPKGKWTDDLFSKIRSLYKEMFMHQLISLKTELEERLPVIDEYYPEKFSKKAIDMKAEEIKKTLGFDFIGDYDLNPHSFKTSVVESRYDLRSLTETLLDFYLRSINIELPKEKKVDFDHLQYTDARYLYFFIKEGEFRHPKDVISDEADPKTADMLFKKLTRQDKSNEYLLYKILRLSVSGRKEELKRYYLGA